MTPTLLPRGPLFQSLVSALSAALGCAIGVLASRRPATWCEATRDAGSPQRLPVYQQGQAVRFIAAASDLDNLPSEWPAPRVLYLQHPSDPIIWWSPSLLFKEPDWLEEPRGDDVLAGTRWFPIVSFLQLAADMAVSTGVPDGHGHHYGADFANAWTAVLQPPGWTAGDTTRLRAVLVELDTAP